MTPRFQSTEVDVAGLLTVLGDHLYSTPVVALRELVQNAHDSITRRRIEDETFAPGAGSIVVDADPATGVVRIADDGSGLTEDEVTSYLATIGAGYTGALRREHPGDERLIGQFGLGFLSAFVVAGNVTVTTTSYRTPGSTWRYRSADGQRYVLDELGTRSPVGTVVELDLKDRHRHLASPDLLARILGRYCCLLPVPITVAGRDVPVNAEPPPWRPGAGDVEEHPVQLRRRRIAFANRFETTFEPLATMPVDPPASAAVDPDASDAAGILWVQSGASYGTSDNRRLAVFVRGMLLDDDARDLLPYWAGFIGGVIESDRLTPTASREDLQRDGVYRAVQARVADAVVTGLSGIARHEPEAWRRILLRHNEALLGAALCDDRLFELLADSVPVPTSHGDLTMPRFRRLTGGRFPVGFGAGGGFEEMLFRAMQQPVARGDRFAVLPFLRRYTDTRGGSLIEIGTQAGDRRLFRAAPLDPDSARWFQDQLAAEHEQVVPVRFEPPDVPLVVVPDREAELKARLDADSADERMSSAALRLARRFTSTVDDRVRARLYLNLACPAVQDLVAARGRGESANAEVAAGLLRSVKTLIGATSLAGAEHEADLLTAAFTGVADALRSLLAARPAEEATA